MGILIPPSIGLILFGVLAEESVGRLYIAGFIPGLLLSVIFMLMIGIMAVFWRGMAPRETGESFTSWESWKIRLVSSLHLLPVLALIFIVLGVIYLGVAAPSEAAAFGVCGAFILAILLNSDELTNPLIGGIIKRTPLIYLFTLSRGGQGCSAAERAHSAGLVYLHSAHYRNDFPDTHGRLHPKLRLCPAGHLATDY